MQNSQRQSSKLKRASFVVLKYLGTVLLFVAFSLVWARFVDDMVPYRAGTSLGFILFVLCVWTAYTDFFARKISNVAVYSAFVAVVAEILWANASGEDAKLIGCVGLASSALGAALCFLIPFVPYLAGQGGAGDVKLAAVVGCALGASEGLLTISVAYVVAFVWALLDMAIRKAALCLRMARDEQAGTSTWKRSIPMAPSFLIAVVATTTGLCQRALSAPLIEF